MAYQGFVSGDLKKDAYAVQLFAKEKLNMIVVQSFSKNFGLYAQRVGCFSMPMASKEEADAMNDFLASRVRKLYSSSPKFGSDIIRTVLKDEGLRKQFQEDILTMSQRIIKMREKLYEAIQKLKPKDDWSYIIKQQGMFAYTHLSKEQVIKLREVHGIYMLEMGRVSMCGVTEENVDYIAKGFCAVSN